MLIPKLLLTTPLLLALVSCGGGGAGGSGHELRGTFVDSPVQGLTFHTPTRNSVTDFEGSFSYLEGEWVVFSVGTTNLGSAPGGSFVTPLSFVPGAIDETNDWVTNRLIFLQTLDDDANPSNGIVINPAVQTAMQGITLNFNLPTASLYGDAGVIQLMSELTALTSAGRRPLVSAITAQSNFRETFVAKYAGTQVIKFTGTVSGVGALTMSPDGSASLMTYSPGVSRHASTAVGRVLPNGELTLTCIGASSEDPGADCATFKGTVNADHSAKGTWTHPISGATGTWTGAAGTTNTGAPLTSPFQGSYTVAMTGSDSGTGSLYVNEAGITFLAVNSAEQLKVTQNPDSAVFMAEGVVDKTGALTLTPISISGSVEGRGAFGATFAINLSNAPTSSGTWVQPVNHAAGSWTIYRDGSTEFVGVYKGTFSGELGSSPQCASNANCVKGAYTLTVSGDGTAVADMDFGNTPPYKNGSYRFTGNMTAAGVVTVKSPAYQDARCTSRPVGAVVLAIDFLKIDAVTSPGHWYSTFNSTPIDLSTSQETCTAEVGAINGLGPAPIPTKVAIP